MTAARAPKRRRGRRPGEVRRALERAVRRMAQAGRTITWRSLAAAARVGWEVARCTVNRMLSAGELVRIGTLRTAATGRPMCVLAPADMAGDAAIRQRAADAAALMVAMRGWGAAAHA